MRANREGEGATPLTSVARSSGTGGRSAGALFARWSGAANSLGWTVSPQQKSRRCRRLLAPIALPRKSMRGVERGFFLPGNRAFHGRLPLLESADLDLP